MINKRYKLTIDDLIVEYMICKIKNGLEPNIYYYEFINFLCNFETEMPVDDILYDNEELFNRFIERKNNNDWKNNPHMEIEYDKHANDYLLKANYMFGNYDKSILNTYFINNDDKEKIHSQIEEYLENFPKRTIEETTELTEQEKETGKYASAQIINYIWLSHIGNIIERNRWPRQCRDINKYLFEIDLAEIIGLESIQEELINLYKQLSLKIATLYHHDKNLKISTATNQFLANSNYKLLREGNERFFDLAFGYGAHKRSLDIDVSGITLSENYQNKDKEKIKTLIYAIEKKK